MIRLPHPIFVLGYVVMLSAVVFLSLIPAPGLGAPEGSDKAAHLIAYGAVAFSAGLGFATWKTRSVAGLASVLVGVALELAQAAWFDRNGSVWDAVANTLGVSLGLAGAGLVLMLAARFIGTRNA